MGFDDVDFLQLYLQLGAVFGFDNINIVSPFGPIGAFPKAAGDANDPPRWTVPVLLGLSVPTKNFGIDVPGLTARFFGGVQFNHRQASFLLTEPGAGNTRTTSAASSWTSADPAVGFGLQYQVGKWANRPVSIGASATFDWTDSHSVNAASANFPSVNYTLNTGRQMDTSLMFNLSVALNPVEPSRPRK